MVLRWIAIVAGEILFVDVVEVCGGVLIASCHPPSPPPLPGECLSDDILDQTTTTTMTIISLSLSLLLLFLWIIIDVFIVFNYNDRNRQNGGPQSRSPNRCDMRGGL